MDRHAFRPALRAVAFLAKCRQIVAENADMISALAANVACSSQLRLAPELHRETQLGFCISVLYDRTVGPAIGGGSVRYELILRFTLVGLVISAGAASASPVLCPNDTTDSKVFIVDTSPDSVCSMTGTGNINGPGDPYLLANPTWEFVDSTGGSNPGTMDGSLTMGTGTLGTFTINSSVWGAYSDLALAIKDGNNPPDPDWGVFILPFNTLTGSWEIRQYDSGGEYVGKDLSHGILYGLPCEEPCDTTTTQVPEPVTLTLFGVGAFGVAMARRRLGR